MALHTPRALPSELGPALQTNLREHFGGHVTLRPHRPPTAAPMYLQPRTEPGIQSKQKLPKANITPKKLAKKINKKLRLFW